MWISPQNSQIVQSLDILTSANKALIRELSRAIPDFWPLELKESYFMGVALNRGL